MADIATIWDPASSRGDWRVPAPGFAFAADAQGRPLVDRSGHAVRIGRAGEASGAGLVGDRDLETAVLISLFTDAAADPEDGVEDPRGWWGDETIGSRLWLRMRAKQTPATLALVKADIEAALAWLMADAVASAVDVSAKWSSRGLLIARVVVRRHDGRVVPLAFEWAWKER